MSSAARKIRNDLQAAGYRLHSFSIRTSRTGSVRVEIRDPAIAREAVARIASRHEAVRRDEASGEILSGGNTFVTIAYASGALAGAGEGLTARLRAGERRFGGIHVDTTGAASSHTWHVWTNDDIGRHVRQISPFDGAALAEILAERGELQGVAQAAWRELAAAPPAGSTRAELDERRAHICVALDLLRRATRELDVCAATDSLRETDRAMNEAETLVRLALGELER